eukprot:TRINITY_DN13887_c0_g1_i3.p1 TRINITY_DN13887_c0_g1~~TRINITY_DN13887_c0_g1_i3.p1  ORF type:complete len:190 (-),score=25.94 TRINITY_DN13887_c0_g1_i3:119-652(-)
MGKGRGFCNFLLALIIIIISICLILLTISWWYAIADVVKGKNNSTQPDWLVITLCVISALVLIIVGVCGILAAILKKEMFLLCFAAANVAMWIFMMIQLIVYYVAFYECQKNRETESFLPDSFSRICDPGLDDESIWIPLIIAVALNTIGCTAAYLLCCRVRDTGAKEKKDDKGNYY